MTGALIAAVVGALVLAVQASRWAARHLAVRAARRYITPDAATLHGIAPTGAVRCPWCPVTVAEGARDDATRDDCTCQADCGEHWCARKPATVEEYPW